MFTLNFDNYNSFSQIQEKLFKEHQIIDSELPYLEQDTNFNDFLIYQAKLLFWVSDTENHYLRFKVCDLMNKIEQTIYSFIKYQTGFNDLPQADGLKLWHQALKHGDGDYGEIRNYLFDNIK